MAFMYPKGFTGDKMRLLSRFREKVMTSAGQVRSFSAFLRSCVRTHRLFRNARTQERKVFQRNASKRNAPPEILKRSSFCE